MDKKEFIRHVTALAPDEVRSFVRDAVEMTSDFIFKERIGYSPYDAPKVVQAAGSLRRYTRDREGVSGLTESKITSPTSLPGEYLVDLITPWVEDVRQTLFDSRTAPFTSVEQANKWFEDAEKNVDEWRKNTEDWQKRSEEKREAFYAKYPHLNLPGDLAAWVGVIPPKEEYEELWKEKPPKWDKLVQDYLDLNDRANEISMSTGFPASSVRLYILADIRPNLLPIEWHSREVVSKLPSSISLTNRFVRLTIRGEVSFQELHSCYQRIKRELNTRRKKGFNKKHLELYQMVRRRGGSPSGKGAKAFCKSVQEEWNETHKHKKDRYDTWKGVQMAYNRLDKKLSDTLRVESVSDMIRQ